MKIAYVVTLLASLVLHVASAPLTIIAEAAVPDVHVAGCRYDYGNHGCKPNEVSNEAR